MMNDDKREDLFEEQSGPRYLENENSFPMGGRPTLKNYLVFGLFFALTAGTTWWAGGWMYSLTLMSILGAHEFGHYWAIRRNKINGSLPFFLPAPPLFIAGTFGAFIHIRQPIPNRPILMEIGAAGPIAGFLVAVPAMLIGLFLSEVIDKSLVQGLNFGNSILLIVFSKLVLGVTPLSTQYDILLHPVAFAAWIGLFVTTLNLLPIGQLDGGQISYALFKDGYKLLGISFFVVLLGLGFYWSGWWIFAGLTALVFRFQHAPTLDASADLEFKHKALGYLSVFIFAVTFIPIPIEFIN